MRRPFHQQVAFFRGKLVNLVPTQTWRDVMRQQHDRAFMVAGAQSADFLAFLSTAVDRAISEGVSLDTFRRDVKKQMQARGWELSGDFNHRTRTIYKTNMLASYSAGRTAQLREANYEFLMYKHGGSDDPRPEHLAWDGLVLPASHPFWQTHMPPNGWNCSCRVIGLRRPEDARLLGGDPGKELPDGWDSRDPKTGAPKGIDEGWDYRPGETVSDIVSTMAEKAQRWDYSLAKAYMRDVPASVRDRMAEAYRALPSVGDAARLYAQGVLQQIDRPEQLTLGLLTSAHAARIQSLKGVGAAGFDFSLNAGGVRASSQTAGLSGAGLPGGRAATPADYARLPSLINSPEHIEDAGRSLQGKPAVRYRKAFGDELWSVILELDDSRETLAVRSLTIHKR